MYTALTKILTKDYDEIQILEYNLFTCDRKQATGWGQPVHQRHTRLYSTATHRKQYSGSADNQNKNSKCDDCPCI